MARTARILRNLRVDEVSSVDQGAGRGVRVVLTKRHSDGTSSLYGKPLIFSKALTMEAEAYLKREFSDDQRQALADKGHALPDGSFPIQNKGDLKNAIQAIGRAKDPAKAKAHIKARAEALGASDMIPDTWTKRAPQPAADVLAALREQVAKNAIDFDDAQAMIECAEDAADLMREVREALCALECSINSIMCDEGVTDKAAAVAQSYDQFRNHLDGLEAGELEKAMTTANLSTTPAVQKMIDDAVAAALVKTSTAKDAEIAKLNDELTIAKMSEKHKAFHSSLGDDEKKKFAAMSAEDRDSYMEKTKKRAEQDPIYKRMQEENADLQKRLTAIETASALEKATKDAKEMGMTASDAGEVLMKARRGEPEAIKKLEEYTCSIAKQAQEFAKTGKIFAEFGKAGNEGGGNGAGAYEQLVAKAADLRKVETTLTAEQAYAKVVGDPANRELVARESQERIAKITRAA